MAWTFFSCCLASQWSLHPSGIGWLHIETTCGVEKTESYVPCHGLEPVVLMLKWLSKLDGIEKDLMEKDADELCIMVAHVSRIRPNEPFLPKLWLLEGKAQTKYWS